MVRGLLGGAICITLMLLGCGTEGVQETTDALGSGYNHCIIVPDPAGSTHWIETGYCLESSEIAVCRQVLSTDCKKGRYGLNSAYNTCNVNVDTNACK
jgi:hypothetical protein